MEGDSEIHEEAGLKPRTTDPPTVGSDPKSERESEEGGWSEEAKERRNIDYPPLLSSQETTSTAESIPKSIECRKLIVALRNEAAAIMVTPTPRTKGVSSRDVLGCTARRLQAGKGEKRNNRESNSSEAAAAATTNSQEEYTYHVVNKIWLSVGLVVQSALLSAARGVRIESLGTFTLDAKGRARFFLAPDFAARYRLLKYDVCSGGCLAGGAVNCRLNLSRVAATAGSPRPEAERVVGAVLRSLHQRLAAGNPVALSFRPVAEFRCSPSEQATMTFLPGFRAVEKKVTVNATRARIGVARTSSKPTPWQTVLSSTIPSASAVGTSDAGNATTAGGGNDSAGRRPCSASSVSRLSITTDRRPGTSHGDGSCKRSPTAPSGAAASVRSCGNTARDSSSSPVTSSVGYGAVGAQTGATSRTTPGSSSSRRKSSGWYPKTAALSCASTRSSSRAPSAAPHEKPSDRNGSNNGDGNETAATGAREGVLHDDEDNASFDHEPPVRLSRAPPRAGHAVSRHQPDRGSKGQETWLSDLLRRQTLAQAGDEGLRRLAEALRLAHVSTESGGRVSGRDLLLALRSAGTTLTSAQLAATRSVFRHQPDRRVSLGGLLAAATAHADDAPQKRAGPSDDGEEDDSVWPVSCSGAYGEQGAGAAGRLSSRAAPRGFSGGLPWEEESSFQAGVTVALTYPPPPPPPPLRAGRGSKRSGGLPLSSSCLSDSSSIHRVLHKARAAEEQASDGCRHGDHREQRQTMPQGGDKERSRRSREENNSSPRACPAAAGPKQARRECWGGEENSSDRGVDDAFGSAAAQDPIAELARIVFRPPCSLERLLHVLQASKVCRVQREINPFSAQSTHSIGCCVRYVGWFGLKTRPGLFQARTPEIKSRPLKLQSKGWSRCYNSVPSDEHSSTYAVTTRCTIPTNTRYLKAACSELQQLHPTTAVGRNTHREPRAEKSTPLLPSQNLSSR